MVHRKESKKAMKKPLIVIILILVLPAGLYFVFNSQNQTREQQSGIFSQNYDNVQQATQPKTVELKNGQRYNLTASIVKKTINNNTVKMLAYNGSIPGPIIKVQQGSQISINFTNHTDVPTTLHPHGVRVDNAFDGVPDVTQKATPVGGSFTYKLKFPDAGVYWYHPHLREDYTQALGLYGNFIVEPTDANYWSPVNEEIPLVLSDILMSNGQIASYNKAQADHTFMGRFGNVLLVNGQTNYLQTVRAGEVVRYYITNTASTRIFDFSIPNAKMKLVGGDNGKVTNEQFEDFVMIAPSERSIVEVYFEKSGNYPILHTTPQHTYTLGTITVKDNHVATSYQNEFNTLRINQNMTASISNLVNYYSKPADKKLKIEADIAGMSKGDSHMMGNGQMMGGNMMMNYAAKIEWEDTMSMMNTNSNPTNTKWHLVDQDTNKVNNAIGWQFKKGSLVKIQIFNDPNSSHPMQHPIHIHGNRFLVLDTNGVKNDNPQWKDTTLAQAGDTVDILVDMSNPGTWMLHCHIPEHLESGMMTSFKVI